MQQRATIFALAALMLGSGCGDGDGPKAGGVYVLSKPAQMWTGGPQSGERLGLDAGAIVRVTEVGESGAGNAFVRVVVERGIDGPLFGDSSTGKSGYIDPEEFDGAPTTAP